MTMKEVPQMITDLVSVQGEEAIPVVDEVPADWHRIRCFNGSVAVYLDRDGAAHYIDASGRELQRGRSTGYIDR
jgi:hypothetical protein